MAVQGGEKGGNDFLVTTAGEGGSNIKFSRAYAVGQRAKKSELVLTRPAFLNSTTRSLRHLKRLHQGSAVCNPGHKSAANFTAINPITHDISHTAAATMQPLRANLVGLTIHILHHIATDNSRLVCLVSGGRDEPVMPHTSG